MLSVEMQRPTWANVALTNLAHNYHELRKLVTPTTAMMAVVKADAYGHGAAHCAPVLQLLGVDWFGVALIEEAMALRAAGITQPICCLGGCWPAQVDLVAQHELTPALFRVDMAQALDAHARRLGRCLPVHLKVDTGMGRYGVPLADLPEFLRALRSFDHLVIDGLMTHFADADSAAEGYTQTQIARYYAALQLVQATGRVPRWRQLANSAALHGHPTAHGNLVRVGAALYGLVADVLRPDLPAPPLRPVLSLHSRIALLKDVSAGTPLGYGCSFVTARASRIATVPIGYADGWPRLLSGRGQMLVRGQRAPIVGRVSMDLTLLDVTDIDKVTLDDEVILIGTQGALQQTAEAVAAQSETISYEIVTGLSARIPRRYLANAKN